MLLKLEIQLLKKKFCGKIHFEFSIKQILSTFYEKLPEKLKILNVYK